jgi:1,4-dihydroxy-2-naphthoyl-CoA hydrolase
MLEMSLWKRAVTLEQLNTPPRPSLVSNLGIEFTEIGEDFLAARMPVDERTIQPFGVLHGGASVALAETLGSVAAGLTLDLAVKVPLGMEINANHLRSATSGWVTGVVRPVHLGKTSQVWEIRITNEAGKLVCISRLTMAVVDTPPDFKLNPG